MNNIKCTVIQDLLPLYIDKVVSEDTQSLVKEHLLTCEVCRNEFDYMTQTPSIPLENNTTLFSKFKKRWNRKKWMLIFGSVLTTSLFAFVLFSLIFYYTKPIPYSTNLFEIEETTDGVLVLNYFGESHAGTYETHPLEVEVDGEIKKLA